MKDLVKGKTMTIREVAEQLGCDPETVRKWVRLIYPNLMQNGKATFLTESQVTVILEKMKAVNRHYDSSERNPTYNNIIEGIETSLSKEFRLAMLYKQKAEIAEEAAALERELRISSERQHQVTKHLLAERETGLEAIQRIAEAGGLLLSDRDDLLATYRRQR